jgi:hypothetical protein
MPTRCADMQLQCSAGPVDHSSGTATVSGDSIAQCHATNQVWRGRTMKQGAPHVIEDIICYF